MPIEDRLFASEWMSDDQKVSKYLFSEIFYYLLISMGGVRKNQNAPRPSPPKNVKTFTRVGAMGS